MVETKVFVSTPENVKNVIEIEEKVYNYLKNNEICINPRIIHLIHCDFFIPLVRLGKRIQEMYDADLVVLIDEYRLNYSVQVECFTALLYDKNTLYLKDSDLKCD